MLYLLLNYVALSCELTIIYLCYFQTEGEEKTLTKKFSKKTAKKYANLQKTAKVEPAIEEQFHTGRLLGKYIFSSID